MKHSFTKRSLFSLVAFSLVCGVTRAAEKSPQKDLAEVLVYPTKDEGSIMHWLCVSPLSYNAAYIGDSLGYDVFKRDGLSELTVRPRTGDVAQGRAWRKISSNGTTEGPSMVELFQVSGKGFDYGITACQVYLYSPAERPGAIFAGSSDDGLKVIWNGKRIWTNQIQRSPTYDSDQVAAPIKKGWNSLLCVVDQVIGGHLLTARFLDGGKAVTDLDISLDPPRADAIRHPAAPYNRKAAELIREADALKADGKLTEAAAAYERLLSRYALADVAARAAYARAETWYSSGGKSLGQPEQAAAALRGLLEHYGQDVLAEYALLDLARLQERAFKQPLEAADTYRGFEKRFPRSPMGARALVEMARLLGEQKRSEESILTYRKAIQKYPQSDEVLLANVGIADTYQQAGDKEKARRQYEAARALARDWHENRYGLDVGKQAWLRGILEALRQKLPER